MAEDNNRAMLLRRVQMYDFALQEARLFLDTHPTDVSAIAYFNKHKKLCEEAKAAFEKLYGPLTDDQEITSGRWEWVDNPWPWEKEAQ
ncbi:MAG: spore coat protein CotJB [Oscillospiraceae bacterium]|nr:spore coat protein CotJB [Oscillospiraceae bacterium]